MAANFNEQATQPQPLERQSYIARFRVPVKPSRHVAGG